MAETVAIELPTVQELKAWVEQQPEGVGVGTCQHPRQCLLAHYLNEKYPALHFSVCPMPAEAETPAGIWVIASSEDIIVKGGSVESSNSFFWEDRVPAPELAELLFAFDCLPSNDDGEGEVTREQALTCFEE